MEVINEKVNANENNNNIEQQLKELQEKYTVQSDHLKDALKKIKDTETKKKEQGSFTVTDVIDAKKEIIRLQPYEENGRR